MKKLLIAAALAAGVVAANADVYDQPYDGTSTGVASQNFSDFTDASTYAFDDVTVAGGWNITQVVIRGQEAGVANQTVASHLRFTQNHSFTAPGTTGLSFDVAGSANLAAGVLTFNLPGSSGMPLAAGTWWISAWIDRPFGTGGQWFWNQTTPVRGSEGWIHNPGGGIGFGTNPVPLSNQNVPGSNGPRDLSFQITYTPVPEPATFLAIGLGIAALAARRIRK